MPSPAGGDCAAGSASPRGARGAARAAAAGAATRRGARRLVDVEARPAGGQLEQHAARLAEVDGVEVLAVDDRGGMRPPRRHPLAPRLLLGVVLGGPRDVVDRPGALDPTLLRRRIDDVERAALCARDSPAVISRALEPERALEQRTPASRSCPYAWTPAKPSSACSAGMPSASARRGGSVKSSARSASSSPSGSWKTRRRSSRCGLGDALTLQPALPEVQRLGRVDAPRDGGRPCPRPGGRARRRGTRRR